MKRKSNAPFWMVLFVAALLLALTACVRPVPQDTPPTSPPTATDMPTDTTQPIPPPQEMPDISTPTPEGGGEPGVPPPTENGDAGGGAPSTDQPPSTGTTSHTVQQGETLSSIASQYGLTAEELATANNLANTDQLAVGQVLVIPAPGSVTAQQPATPAPTTGEQVHVVQAGENLFRISLRYGFTVQELAAYNNIPDPSRIYVGQVIRIPPR